jgi:hypothetical protein
MATRKKVSQESKAKELETTKLTNPPPEPVTESPIEEFSKKIIGPRYFGGVKHFSKHDLMQLELFQLRTVAHLRDVNLKEIEIQKFTTEAKEKIERMNKELDSLKSSYLEKIEKLSRLNQEIETTYKISLKSVTYDEADGKIFEHYQFKKE